MMQTKDIQIRDPFVVLEEGVYYLFGSTDKDIWQSRGVGFDVYTSSDLTAWEGPYAAFRPEPDFWSEQNFWAPEVYRYNGAYYMFATFKPKAGRRGTAVLRSESLLGPFTLWSDGPVTPAEWECLDGTLYIDPAGNPFMVFCHEWQQVKDGEICAMPLTRDLCTAAGEPSLLFRATEAVWVRELAGRDPGNFVTDGPFLWITDSGALVLLWSSFGAEGYCIGIARSKTGAIAGPWVQAPKPLFAKDGGHGMLFRSKEGKLYLTIHRPNKTPDERALFIALTDKDLTAEV
ncbi:MAG: glycoside hydrolase family 43 protein [Spirochaetaceae bacterium]|jgi:beta-xylosidase|nr:glycoside hydrolase family 43 protein [Spirochaetaceae bacterium]